jgi:dihydrofolate synthase/folylpolyglutamate synthase
VLEVLYQLGILQTIVASENKADILAKGILSATIAGRFQQLQLKGVESSIDAILDVAHNPQAARVVVDMVKQLNISNQQQTITVIAMLKDKEMLSVVEELSAITDHWMVAGVAESSRGASAEELQKVVELSAKNSDENRDEINIEKFRSVEDAFIASINLADNLDKSARILVLGSFYSVAAVLNAEKIGTIELRI